MPRENERTDYFNEVMLEWASGRRVARINDVSFGGCYVDTIATLPENEELTLEVRNSDGQRMIFSGTVAHVFPNAGFGVKFRDLTEEQTAFLSAILEKD